jgi:hypothetical protein
MNKQLTVIRRSEISGVLCDPNKDVTYFFLKGGNFICVNTATIKEAFDVHSEDDMKDFLMDCIDANDILTLFDCQVQEISSPDKNKSPHRIW